MGKTRAALGKVATGFQMIYIGLVLVVLSVFAGVIGGAMAASALARQPGLQPGQVGASLNGVVLAAVGLALVGNLLDIVGRLFCLSVPKKSGSSGLIQVSVALTLVGLILNLYGQFGGHPLASSASGIFTLVGAVIFVLFIMDFAHYLNRTDLADRGRTVLIGTTVLVALMVVSVVGTIAMKPGAGQAQAGPVAALALLMVGVMIGLLVMFVKYANLIGAMRDACGRASRGVAME